jgi:hypothetical protein
VALSEQGSGPGTITATRLTPDGGRFNSSFPVVPKLVFTDGSGKQVVIDCGVASGCRSPFTLSLSNYCWVVAHGPNGFDPAAMGLTPIEGGIAVDGTGDGVNDYVTIGNTQSGSPGLGLYTGYDAAPPWNKCTSSSSLNPAPR